MSIDEKLLNFGAVKEENKDPRQYQAEAILGGLLDEKINYRLVRNDGVLFDIERIMAYVKRVGVKQFRSRPWTIAYAQEINNIEADTVPLKTDNQAAMDNCVFQSWSKYGEVINFLETLSLLDFSSRFKFPDYCLPYGAYLSSGGKSAVKSGFALESQVTSYKSFLAGGKQNYSMDQGFARSREGVTPEVEREAMKYKGKSFAEISSYDLELIAKIIILNFGAVGGYYVGGMEFQSSHKNIFRLNGSPKSLGHANYFGRVSLEDGKLTVWSKDSYGDWNGRDRTNGWLGHQDEEIRAGMTFDWYTMIDADNLPVGDALAKEAAKKQLQFMIGRKAPYFQRVEAKGEVYKYLGDSFRYMQGVKCDLFDDLSRSLYFTPISEVLWEKIKILES